MTPAKAGTSASQRPSSSRSISIENTTPVLYHPAGRLTSVWTRGANCSGNPSLPATHLQTFDRQDTPKSFIVNDAEFLDGLFQQAVAAIDAGDTVTLERLLAEHPRLVRDQLESPGEW